MRNALCRGGIAVVGDDHPRGLAVRGQEQLHAAFELGVVEHLRRQIERAVVLGLVERLAHGVGVLQRLLGLREQPGLGGGVVLRERLIALLDGDLLGDQRQQLGLQGVELVQAFGDLTELIGELIDTVEGVEYRSQRRAQRNIETVRLPVEVIAQRPEEVVEVGGLVAQILDRLKGLLEGGDLFVGGGGGLLLQVVLLLQQRDRVGDLRDLREQIVSAGLLERQVLDLCGTLRAHRKTQRGVVQRGAQRPGDGLHHGHPGRAEHIFGDALEHDHVGRGAQIAVGFDHQHFGVEPRGGEVAFGRGIADLGRRPVRLIVAGVVGGLVSGQGQQTDEGHRDRGHQDRPGPAHDGGADAPPAAGAHGALGVEQSEMAAHRDDRRCQGQRSDQGDQHTQAGRNSEALEVRRAGEAQTEHRRGDGQARTDDHVRGAAVHREVGGLAILTVLPRLLIAAQEEDRVIRSGRDDEQRQQVGRVRRQRDHPDVTEEGDHTAGRGHLDRDGHQCEQHGGDGPVDDQQHQPDHPEGERGDLEVAALTDRELVGDQCRRATHICLDPRRSGCVGHDLADGRDRLVGLTAAGVADQIGLDERRFAVAALRTRRRERITPEVLDVLNAIVLLQTGHQIVAETVRLSTQRRVAFEHERDEAVGVVLAEHRPDPLGGD